MVTNHKIFSSQKQLQFDLKRGKLSPFLSSKIKENEKVVGNIKSMFVHSNGSLIESNKPKLIGQEYDRFASELYSHKEMEESAANSILNSAQLPFIPNDLLPLEQDITIEEVDETITNLSNSAPGEDSLNHLFYKKFKNYLSKWIVDFANVSIKRVLLTDLLHLASPISFPKSTLTQDIPKPSPISTQAPFLNHH